ncbi:hypothetical protein [Corynebacterium doosanense]|uniref:Helix-turn-helix domain-containing protein n=1 Tax=Corynebacterium doosanense CAU 212 = DSM 45436 TaxID=558173 RepID=A0A097IDF5_9CORY|nr:hypothetical protein [Corynebacterium doosanense]AIT60157.1 hypothetical protein CDOO_01910 [Corynebacterium doosanense CAU 212 = DSM 45436]
MDDQLMGMLSKHLLNLENDLPGLDDLLLPRQATSGENAGKPPARRGSKVPLVVSILDVKIEAERTLHRWVGALLRAVPEVGSAPMDPPAAARWLFGQVGMISEMPWAGMCAEEIIGQARLVSDVVMPPEEKDAPDPLEVGGVREIVSWARNLGAQASTRSVYRWVERGVIPSELAPDGRVLVRLADVLEACRDQRKHDVAQVN